MQCIFVGIYDGYGVYVVYTYDFDIYCLSEIDYRNLTFLHLVMFLLSPSS